MKKVLLTDVCDIQYGYPFDSTLFNDREGTPLIRIRDIVRGFSETYTTEQAPKDYLVYQGDILVGMDGEFNVAKWGGTPGVLNQRVCRIFPSRLIDKEYLFHYLPVALKRIEDATPFVTVKHLSAKALAKIQIPAHEPLLQTKIANSLSGICSLINIRKAQLLKLEQLASSRFIEMFGSDAFPVVSAKDVCEFITKGTTPSTTEICLERRSDEIPFLKVYNLSFSGELLFDECPQFINKNIHNGILARSKVYPNDVLMNIVGPPLGKFSLVTNDYPEWNINQAIAIFRAKEQILPRYLMSALMQPSVLKPFLNKAVGIRQLNLNLEQCRALQIPLPPLELQNKFAAFVEQLDKSKVTIRKSLEKLETTYRALLQEYFG